MIVLEGEYKFGVTMHSPLIVEPQDPKWLLLQKVLTVVSTRRTKQKLSKKGITPVASAEQAIKIALVAMFFSVNIAYVVVEDKNPEEVMPFHGNSGYRIPSTLTTDFSVHVMMRNSYPPYPASSIPAAHIVVKIVLYPFTRPDIFYGVVLFGSKRELE